GTLGFLAALVHRDITEFWHNESCVWRSLGVFHHFFNSCVAVEYTAQPIFAQGYHSQFDGLLAEHDGGRAFIDQGANCLTNDEQLENAFAALVTGVVAIRTAAPVVEHLVTE